VPTTIRDARPDDADAIARLLDQLGYPTDPTAVESRLERLRIVGDRLVVAEVDGEVVGLAQLHVSPTMALERPAAKIDGLVVDESYRGRGVGRALVAEMEAEARVRGCSLLYITTAARRQDAHEFYRRVGLKETGLRFAKPLDQTDTSRDSP
jgi:N-acetylglutamate synthase-like GNAT family acetyltransferase